MLTVEVITPTKKVYEGAAQSLHLPGVNGNFEVLTDHAAMVSALANGTLKVKNGSNEQSFQIEGGVAEILKNKVIVLAEKVIQ